METSLKETIIKLHNLANELEIGIENPKVPIEFCKRVGGFNDEVYDKLIEPLYTSEKFESIKIDKEGKWMGKKKNGEWIPLP